MHGARSININYHLTEIMIVIAERNFARRYYANFIDYFIIIGFSFVYVFIAGEPDYDGTYHVSGLPALLVPLLWFLYFPVAESVFHQTLGKAAFNLIVISSNGEPASLGQCLLKRITDPIELAFFGIPAAIMITQTDNGKRLGDILGNTLTVRSSAKCSECAIELSLTTKEALKGKFTCPECGVLNQENDR